MNVRQRRNFQLAGIVVAIAMVMCVIFQYVTVSAYNDELHVSSGRQDAQECFADMQFRGGNTASWYKQDTGLTGQIFDATVTNKTPDLVKSWTMVIDITENCYLNQFWNGLVEIHQHVAEGEEIVQTLDLANYDVNDLKLDYQIDGSDLLIPLTIGDYIVYHPSEEFSETPLESGEDTVVGVIFYYEKQFDLPSQHVEYYCHREFTDGLMFDVIVGMGVLLIFVLGAYLIAERTYRQARKELELRKSGLSCMSELYAIIYLIDLEEDTIVPIGVSEEDDKARPKNLSPNDQLKNLFKVDAKRQYIELAQEFADLGTISQRLEKRNSIVFEYESRVYGWCRIRFIAMDRAENGSLEKVLFTIEQINDEKQELHDVLEQAERARSQSEEQGALLESVTKELQVSFDEMLGINDLIMRESTEKQVQRRAEDMYAAGIALRLLVRNSVDYFRVQMGKMGVNSADYSLKDTVLYALGVARMVAQNDSIDFQMDVAPSLPDRLRGDSVKIRRALINMLVEAARIPDVTTVKLSIYGKNVDGETIHLLISVTSSRELEAAQNKSTRSFVVGGGRADLERSGVGMSLSRSLVSLMESKLNVADAYEGGKTFYFEVEQQIVEQTTVGALGLDDSDRGAR